MSNLDTEVLIDEKVKVVTTEPEKYRVILPVSYTHLTLPTILLV